MTASRRSFRALGAVGVALLLVATACTADIDTAAPSDQGACDPSIAAALSGWEAIGFSGTVAFLGGDRECIGAYGSADPASAEPMTVGTTFSIGSVTKSVTAAAIGRLVANGELAYDDRAGDVVPGLGGPAGEATIEQLLLYTAGLTGSHGRDHDPLARNDAIAALSGLDIAHPAGEDFLYSNAGYATLALVVDAVTGDYRRFVADEVLQGTGGFWAGEPAAPEPRAVGIDSAGDVGFDGDFDGPHWALDGAGGVAMTAPELAAWTQALFTTDLGGPGGAEALMARAYDQGDGTAEVPGWVRLDAAIFGEPLLGSTGGGSSVGHEVTVAWLPESERVFVIASNAPDVPAEQLLQALIGDLVAGRAPSAPEVGGAVPADVAEQVAGAWHLADSDSDSESEAVGLVEIVVGEDGLVVTAWDGRAIDAVLPIPDRAAARAHADLVLAVAGGSTEEGRRERELLEEAYGPIVAITETGTWFADIEYRTYLDVAFADGSNLAMWIALDDAGGVAAAEIQTPPPSIRYLLRDDGTFAPIDVASGAVDLHLRVDDTGLVFSNDGVEHRAEHVAG
ncbi:MAG: serine hydrolase domain-containing protein [Actinomycetota bacterium]